MLNTLRSLGLKLFSLRSLIVLSVCLYYFVGMQVGTAEGANADSVMAYKVTFIGGILGLFSVYFATRYRLIFKRLSSRSGILMLLAWLFLITVLQQPSLIFMLVIVLTFYDKDYKKMAGYFFVWLSMLFITFALLASVGVIDSGEMLKYNLLIDVSDFESVTALGMGNPNTAMAFLLGIIMSGAYVYYDTKHKKKYGIVMLLIAITVFTLVGSRTGLICAVLFLALYMFDTRRLGPVLRLMTPSLMVLLFILSVYIGLNFGQTSNAVNDVLTTRPYQWGLRLEAGALTNIVGNSDQFVTGENGSAESFPLDNQYIYLLARGGWATLLVVFAIYFAGLRKINSPVVMYMVFVSVVQCFVESLMFTAIVNIGLLFMLSSLMLKNDKKVDYRE